LAVLEAKKRASSLSRMMTARRNYAKIFSMKQRIKHLFGSDIGSTILAVVKMVSFLGLIICMVPVQLIYTLRKSSDPFRIPRLFHRWLLWLLGLRVEMRGVPAETKPVLFVANHSSYLDIPVLGSIVEGAFVAKSDVGRWPLFGFLSRLQKTVFVDRRPSRADDHSDDLRTRLESGQNIILFPEGTSSDGLYVLPFKSGLFAAAEGNLTHGSVTVQPVSITCVGLDGLPITRALRPYYAWFGDMTFVEHLWNAFRIGRFSVEVIFHAPVAPETFADRKALAHYCEEQVAHGIAESLSGRHGEPPAARSTVAAANDDALADA
jgi:1-acyl-sn-glycerol-3-phosphate acyltransferase